MSRIFAMGIPKFCIIQSLKCHYRRRILTKHLSSLGGKVKININLIFNSKAQSLGQYPMWEDDIPFILLRENVNQRSEDEIQLHEEYEIWKENHNINGVTFEDYCHIISVLRPNLKFKENTTEAHYKNLNEMEYLLEKRNRNMLQTNISDYFKPK